MNGFTPLLEKQTLVIDNHHPGLPLEWGKGLHIDKRFHGEKRGGFVIRFPLDNDMDISVTPKGDTREPRVMKEIHKAFNDSNTRKRFAHEINEAIEEFKGENLKI